MLVLVRLSQVVLLRAVLLKEAHPLQHLSPRRLPSLDAELLVRGAFEVTDHVPTSRLSGILIRILVALYSSQMATDYSSPPQGLAGGGHATPRLLAGRYCSALSPHGR